VAKSKGFPPGGCACYPGTFRIWTSEMELDKVGGWGGSLPLLGLATG
jgi:hypothetical protein